MAPVKPGEAAEVTVGRNPFAPRFYGERGQVSILNQVPLDARHTAQPNKDPPVSRPGCYSNAIGLASEFMRKPQSRVERTGRAEDARMSDDSQEAGEYQVGHAVGLV